MLRQKVDHHPDSAADVGATTDEGDAVQSSHDVMLRRVRVEMELDRGVVGERDGTDTSPFQPDVHQFDDFRQQLDHARKPLDADSV